MGLVVASGLVHSKIVKRVDFILCVFCQIESGNKEKWSTTGVSTHQVSQAGTLSVKLDRALSHSPAHHVYHQSCSGAAAAPHPFWLAPLISGSHYLGSGLLQLSLPLLSASSSPPPPPPAHPVPTTPLHCLLYPFPKRAMSRLGCFCQGLLRTASAEAGPFRMLGHFPLLHCLSLIFHLHPFTNIYGTTLDG